MPARRAASRMTAEPSCGAESGDSSPWKRPSGVRTAAAMTIGSFWVFMAFSFGNCARRRVCSGSETFLERAQIDLMRPCRPRLPMQLPKGFGNRVDPQQTILPAFFDEARQSFAQTVPVDAAVDHDMD